MQCQTGIQALKILVIEKKVQKLFSSSNNSNECTVDTLNIHCFCFVGPICNSVIQIVDHVCKSSTSKETGKLPLFLIVPSVNKIHFQTGEKI